MMLWVEPSPLPLPRAPSLNILTVVCLLYFLQDGEVNSEETVEETDQSLEELMAQMKKL